MLTLWNDKQAAEYLREKKGVKVSYRTLAKYRSVGGGPRYRYFGRTPLYDEADLDSWVDERLSPPRRTTSEAS